MKDKLTHQTLVEAAMDRAAVTPDKVVYEFIGRSDARESITYGELHHKALRVGAALQKLGGPGARGLLPSTSSLDFHVAFLGCMYARMVAIPVATPRVKPSTPDRGLGRFCNIVRDSGAIAALFSDFDLARMCDGLRAMEDLRGLHLLTVSEAVMCEPLSASEIIVTGDTLAFLQYSSGSTAKPKGVMLTHGNIVANQRQIQERVQAPMQATIVSWLPLSHDMGLCAGFFMGLYLGVPAVLLHPFSFVSRPELWLREISRHDWVASAAPNFAYELCWSKIDDETLMSLDLSGWQRAIIGGEPIHANTMMNFGARFSAAGFEYERFYPCFGLAEATLLVTGGEPVVRWFDKRVLRSNQAIPSEPDPAYASPLVSSGQPPTDVRVTIVDPETGTQLEDGRVGEIWVSSPSAGAGYWGESKMSSETFGQTLANEPDSSYFRTGDLGFLCMGELFVSGRIKEMIIINGVNYYPQDIECVAKAACPGLKVAAAFAIGKEPDITLALMAEASTAVLQGEQNGVVRDIRKAVYQELGLALDQVILVKRGSVPRTTSGKIQRGACAQLLAASLANFSAVEAVKAA